MRSLTVKREKTFVGCAVKAKVYIADENGDTEINGVPCSFLGELKNNEEKTFEITEAETRVFVIADKISKDYCNDSRLIPAGTESVVLTGKNRFNLNNGNAFRFDGEPDDFAQLNRVNGTKKGAVPIIIALVVGFAIGFALIFLPKILSKEKTSTITWDELTMTVKGDFEKDTSGDTPENTALYFSNKIAVYLMKEPPSEIVPADMTEKDYADFLVKLNGAEDKTSVQQEDGLTFFKFSSTVPVSGENVDFYYNDYVFKGEKYFYLVQIYTMNEPSAKTLKEITDIAKSIKVN